MSGSSSRPPAESRTETADRLVRDILDGRLSVSEVSPSGELLRAIENYHRHRAAQTSGLAHSLNTAASTSNPAGPSQIMASEGGGGRHRIIHDPAADGENSRRLKRRKLNSDRLDSGFGGFTYGRYGQVEPGKLTMELDSCDGGRYPDDHDGNYAAENVLRSDDTVYCTKGNRCNLVLKHQGTTPFCLKELIIKAPPRGFTSPVQEGMIFVSMDSDELLQRTADYQIQYSAARSSTSRRREQPIISIRHNQHDGSLAAAQAGARRLYNLGLADDDCDLRPAEIPREFTAVDGQTPAFQVTIDCSNDDDKDDDDGGVDDDDDNNSSGYGGRGFSPDYMAARRAARRRTRYRLANLNFEPSEDENNNNNNNNNNNDDEDDEDDEDDDDYNTDDLRNSIVNPPPPNRGDPPSRQQSQSRSQLQSQSQPHSQTRSQSRSQSQTQPRPQSQFSAAATATAGSAHEPAPPRARTGGGGGAAGAPPLSQLDLSDALEASQRAMQEAVMAVGGGLMAPHARFYMARDKSRCTVRFEPPVSGRFILLKLWSPHHSNSGNIDIQSVQARGYAGPRYFPAVRLR